MNKYFNILNEYIDNLIYEVDITCEELLAVKTCCEEIKLINNNRSDFMIEIDNQKSLIIQNLPNYDVNYEIEAENELIKEAVFKDHFLFLLNVENKFQLNLVLVIIDWYLSNECLTHFIKPYSKIK